MVRITSTFGRILFAVILVGFVVFTGNSLVWADDDHSHDNSNHEAVSTELSDELPRELIVITVSEYGEVGFSIDITPTDILSQLHTGQVYDVLIVNAGGIAHELMLLPADMAQMSHEHAEHGALLNVTTDQLSHRGAEVRTEFFFPETGEYTFICHLHPGMEITITVES